MSSDEPLLRGKDRIGGTMAVHKKLMETSEEYCKKRLEIEKFTQIDIKQQAASALRKTIIKIPTVVHVIFNTTEQNISDAQIQSQIDVLNRDFRKLITDIDKIPTVFVPRAADACIEFQLATRDPNGNSTNGITRTQTNEISFSHDDTVKSNTNGGKDPWPVDEYLNIWVCRLRQGLLGYAQFPGGPPETDGVVVNYRAFGTNEIATAPFNKGRTSTHEVGHWLNLLHIWGDDDGGCEGSDNVADTPNQASPNYGCPDFPHISCDNVPDGDMFMNFMDYVDDGCMHMFTTGQVARMHAALHGPRSNLLTSDGLSSPSSSQFKTIPERLGAEFEEGTTKIFDGLTWIAKTN